MQLTYEVVSSRYSTPPKDLSPENYRLQFERKEKAPERTPKDPNGLTKEQVEKYKSSMAKSVWKQRLSGTSKK